MKYFFNFKNKHMRISIFIILMSFSIFSFSQIEFGMKLGLSSSDLSPKSILFNNGESNFELSVAKANYGFHFGLYSRIKLANIYVEPAVLFNSSSVDYNVREEIFETGVISTIRSETFNKLDIPVMVGMKFGFFRIHGGPVAHIFLNSASELTAIGNYDQKFEGTSFGIQAGIGLDILKIRVDVNYETNLSKFGEHINIGGTQYGFERPGRIIASIGIRF